MSLFHSENPKEEQHHGVVGAFSVDNIKWEPEDEQGASLVAFRYPYEDFPNGSYLHVAQSQMAVFCNNMAAGSSLDDPSAGNSQVSVFVGPCKIQLDTGDSRFAPFRNATHALTGGSSAFHSTVYFINTSYMNELMWGTAERFLVMDPIEEVNINVGANGLYGVHIEQNDSSIAPIQARKFLTKVVATRGQYTREELTNFMRAKIQQNVVNNLADMIDKRGISILKINRYLNELSADLKSRLTPYFDEFGLTLDNFSITSINPDPKDLELVNEMKIQAKRTVLEAAANAKKMETESKALADKRLREGYTYQEERGMDVMQSAASNEGNSASGLMGAGMGLGMGVGVGSAFGAGFSNLANQTVGAISGTAGGAASGANPAQPSPDMHSMGQGTGIQCPKCGRMNPSGAKFCLECGSKLQVGKVCPNCGHVNPQEAKFCLECGTRLGASVCPNCGQKLPDGTKFCPNCGTKI